MTEILRNLEQDRERINSIPVQYTISTFSTIEDKLKVISLHAIDRAIKAERQISSIINNIESLKKEKEMYSYNHALFAGELREKIESQKVEIDRLRESLKSLLPNVRGIEITIESTLSQIQEGEK